MRFTSRLSLIIFFLVLSCRVDAQDVVVELTVGPGTAQEIVDAIENLEPGQVIRFIIHAGPDGENTVFFNNVTPADPNGVISPANDQEVQVVAGQGAQTIIFNGVSAPARLGFLFGHAIFRSAGISFQGWVNNGDGAVFLVTENSIVDVYRCQIADNASQAFGGFAAGTANGRILITECLAYRNSAQYGGVFSVLGNATAWVPRSIISDNNATSDGCTAHAETTGNVEAGAGVFFDGTHMIGECPHSEISNPSGIVLVVSGTNASVNAALRSTGTVRTAGSSFPAIPAPAINHLQAVAGSGGKPEALCEDFGTGAIQSLGFNHSEDDSCDLDQASDLEGVDGMLEANGFGILVPQPGSPLIDSGETGTQVFPGDTMESLNCGYKDVLGLGAPQDANNDGVFECDRGAVEVAGPGAMAPGHSSAFYNSLRNGEGQYVEMLSADTAVVYTFTYRPDGGGAAWFTGVGYVFGNSIVIDQIWRPSGTSFGNGFDSTDIVNAFAGGQSMVFNDCKAASPGGSVAFSGNRDIGYEALVTRAERLSDVLGCGELTPHPNAGLSGSYYLPARNGEGIVVQWLPNGQVLVIFFTYDLNGDQQWVTGIGTSDGFSVTIDALYPSSSTSWGSDFDPDEVVLSPWGTFELTWTECGGVQFSYNSTVPGYGSATRDYIRLSNLWEASCPEF